MNLKKLIEKRQQLLQHMKEDGYTKKYIKELNLEIDWILSNANTLKFESYEQAFRLKMKNAPEETLKYLFKQFATTYGNIMRFDLYDMYPCGETSIPLIQAGAYYALCPEYRAIADHCLSSGRKRGLKEHTVKGIVSRGSTFLSAMQLGIFKDTLNVFSPYYRQASLSSVEANAYNAAADIAYSDVSAAFEYYMENINRNRPFVLSGFSQGAEMCLRLMKEYPEYMENMIACYMYGWPVTEADLKDNPQIVPATGECDTGVVICFNSEAVAVNDTFTVPAGTKSICINPLNWKTDGTPADKMLNKGACFADYGGSITEEISGFTGAYIDESRGTLKLPDVDPESYPAKLAFLKYGEYHLYEYEFFYRNLKENVEARVKCWFEK